MATRAEATLDDLRSVEGKAELVNGEIVHLSPTGGRHGYASTRIVVSLDNYSDRTSIPGHAIGDNVGYIVNLPHRRSFSPDAAFFQGELTDDFLEGAPIFAVEIRSKEDYGPAAERRLAAKRADYFAAGARVVWDVDLKGPVVVRAYRGEAPTQPREFRRGDLADAEPAVPGWTMLVDEFFPPEHSPDDRK